MAFTAKILSWRFHHLNIVGCLLKRRPTKGGSRDPPGYCCMMGWGASLCPPTHHTNDSEQSLFCFRFSESNARARERQSCETRLSRLAPSVTRVAICVSRVLRDGLQKCIYHGLCNLFFGVLHGMLFCCFISGRLYIFELFSFIFIRVLRPSLRRQN